MPSFTTTKKTSHGTKAATRMLILSGAAAIALMSAPSYAGFQYVPTNGAASSDQSAPADAGASEPVAPVASQPLTPSDQAMPAPVNEPMHTLVVPAGKVRAAQEQDLTPAPTAQQEPEQKTVKKSAPKAEEKQAEKPAPLLKIRTVSAPEATSSAQQKTSPSAGVVPIAAPVHPAAPVLSTARAQASLDTGKNIDDDMVPPPQEQAAAPPPPTFAAPTEAANTDITWNPMPGRAPAAEPPAPAIQNNVIMPKDAPIKAVNATQAGHRPALIINPYPAPGIAELSDRTQTRPANVATTAPAGGSGSTEVFTKVDGFGSDMPLALALQQIAPPSYAFAFGNGVNPGARISWDGHGRPWNEVIAEALMPVGMTATIEGHSVRINRIPGSPDIAPQQKSEAEPAKDAAPANKKVATIENLRRTNVRDPGEAPKEQPLSAMADVEPASAPSGEQTGAPSDARPLLPPSTSQENSAAATPKDPAPATADAASATGNGAQVWQAHQGDSLKQTLSAWSKQAGFRLFWSASHDYIIDADVKVENSFENAVQTVVNEGVKAKAKPALKFMNAAGGKSVGGLAVEDPANAG